MTLVAPVAKIIRAKVSQLEGLGAVLDRHRDLVAHLGEQIKSGASEEITEKILQDIAALEQDVEALARPQAFKSHSVEVQAQFLAVAEFDDEWFSFGSAGGAASLYMRSWYLCWCGAAISSKVWARRFVTPWQKRQKYYCCLCQRVYKHSFGQVVEAKLTPNSQPSFALAEVPPKPIEDIRASGLELKLKPETPMDLYEALSQFRPTVGAVFRPATEGEVWLPPSHMTKKETAELVSVLTPAGKAALEANPPFNWYQIFNWA